ncbi:MAG: phosphatase PAP2 family protein [Bacteroidota bacterium]
MKKSIVILFMVSLSWTKAQSLLSNEEQFHKTAGDVLLVVLPTLSMGSTLLWKDGQKGALQFSKSLAGTLALSYALKLTVRKERPNGENNYSFPSGHTSVAFGSAAFLQKRYGWEVGIPSYLLAGYVGYTRIRANKHDGWDVMAGAVIGFGMGYLFAKPLRKDTGFKVSPGLLENTPILSFTYTF